MLMNPYADTCQWLDAAHTVALLPRVLAPADGAALLAQHARALQRAEYRDDYVPDQRRSSADVPLSLAAALQPCLEALFAGPLTLRAARVQAYGVGDFMVTHVDRTAIARGQVAVSVLLNAPPAFRGGARVCYDGQARMALTSRFALWGDPVATVTGPAGSAVAFRVTVPHEVQPVTEGQRVSLTLYYD